MNTFSTAEKRIRQGRHRRQVFWQVIFPLIVGLALITGSIALTILTAAQGGSIRQAADASLIALILPAMVLSILPLAFFGGLAYGVSRLYQILPPYLNRAQDLVSRIQDEVQARSDALVQPIIKLQSTWAAFQALTPKRKR